MTWPPVIPGTGAAAGGARVMMTMGVIRAWMMQFMTRFLISTLLEFAFPHLAAGMKNRPDNADLKE